MSTYYPSLVLNFKILFDENALSQPRTPAPNESCARVRGAVIPALQNAEPALLQRASEVSYILNRVPKKASIELPGYRQAGTMSATLDFRDLPIDPRTIRSAAVEVHMGAVRPDDMAAGMSGARGSVRRGILRTRNADRSINLDTLVAVCTIDEWEVEHTDKGSEVSIKGRDLRGILLDSPLCVDGLNAVNTSQAITDIVSTILSFHPFGTQIRLEVNPAEWPNGIVPAPAATDLVPRHRRRARTDASSGGARRGGARNSPQGRPQQLTFWDAIVRYCYLCGAIPYFDGLALKIRPSRSIFEQQRAGFDPRTSTPFAGGRPRQVGNGDPFSVRRLVYGRDIEKVSIKRKLGGNSKPKVVRVVSIDMDNGGRVIEESYPSQAAPPAQRATSASPGQNTSQSDFLNIPVYGIRDREQLAQIARNVFEEIGRNEVGGSVDTHNLASFGGDNEDADILRLRPGDGVEFFVDVSGFGGRSPVVAEAVNDRRAPEAQRIEELAERLGDANLARAIVVSARASSLQLPRFFRVATVKYDWSADKGIGVSFDYQNYVVSRYSPNELQPTPAGVVRATTTPGRAG